MRWLYKLSLRFRSLFLKRSACGRSDCENQPIVCDFVPVLFCERSQVRVCGIAFVCDICRKDAPTRTQYSFGAHPSSENFSRASKF